MTQTEYNHTGQGYNVTVKLQVLTGFILCMEARMNVMKLLHFYDFYLLEAMRAGFTMAKSARPELEFKHSFVKLENDVQSAFQELTDTMAKRIRLYMWAAALGEARHARGNGLMYIDGLYGQSRSSVFHDSTQYAMSRKNIDTLKDVYNQKGWGSSYGGRAWLEIVEAMDLYGKITDAAFIDHAVDLQHNGGTLFNKGDARHAPVSFDVSYSIHEFLDLKFQKNILTCNLHGSISRKVERFLQRYNNVVENIRIQFLKVELDWLTPFDVWFGDKEFVVGGTKRGEIKTDEGYRRDRRNEPVCSNCGDRIDRNNHWHDEHDNCICEDCFDDNYFCCEKCSKTIDADEKVEVDGWTVCEKCAINKLDAVQCSDCNRWTTDYNFTDDGECFCENCINDHTDFCRECGEWIGDIHYHNEHVHEDVYCKECEEIVRDLDEHNLENHYKPAQIQDDAEGIFESEFQPIEPFVPYVKYLIDWNGDKQVFEAWYESCGLTIVTNNKLYSLITNDGSKLSAYPTIKQCFELIQKVKHELDWTTITQKTWGDVEQSKKDAIYKIIKELE